MKFKAVGCLATLWSMVDIVGLVDARKAPAVKRDPCMARQPEEAAA